MLFNSFEFLLFFPVVLILYYLIPHKYRWLFLLVSSYYFYMAHTPELALLLLTSTVVDYCCGLYMERARPIQKKMLLSLSILVNIGILIAFKYLAFFVSAFEDLFSFFDLSLTEKRKTTGYNFDNILLPVGISFYTFQTLSYTIDMYRGKIKAERHLGKFALYVSFFPQLVAGPIERANRLLPQLKKRIMPNVENIKTGIIYMAWGFFLKLVVSDRIGIYVDQVFMDSEQHKGLPAVLGAVLFGYQIYYDFSAYTAIAIGAAKTMGIRLIHNFNRPFFSTSIAQFWARWHISLTHWIRDYVYSPLRGKYKNRRAFAILVVFFVIGLWHGANWTFIVWGLLNGVFLTIEVATAKSRKRVFRKIGLNRGLINVMAWIIVKFLMIFSLVFFRSPSLADAKAFLYNALKVQNFHINILGSYFELFLIFFFITGVQLVHFYKGNNRIHEIFYSRPVWGQVALCTVFAICIVLFSLNKQNSFIYFQF